MLLSLLSEVVAAAMYYAAKFDSDALFHKATHDGLTDLANRSLFMDRLRNATARSDRDRRPTAVLMIDMDGLKQINDTHGHRVGDAVLREFAKRLQASSRTSDTVARLGGDEFAVILAPIERTQDVDAARQRFVAEMQSPFVFESKPLAMRASIGAACCPDDSSEFEQLLEIADRRMYADKRMHRQCETAAAA